MTLWIVGYCTDDDCGFIEVRVKEGRFTHLDVTKAMIEHSEATGHTCRSRKHYRA